MSDAGYIAAPLVVVGLLPVAPASAKPPIPIPTPDPVELVAGDYRDGFKTVVTYTDFSQRLIKDTKDPESGIETQKITGNAVVKVKNDSTGKSGVYNISGPGTVVINLDGSFSVDAHGPNLFGTTKVNSFEGVPQISYSTGHVTFAVAPDGKTTSYTLAENRTDVCDALE